MFLNSFYLFSTVLFAVYRYLNPIYIEDGDFEDEYEELFEDDYIPETSDTDFAE